MWSWLAGWCAVAVAAAWLHRRVQCERWPDLAGFVQQLETELARAHPHVEFRGLLPNRLACLLCVDGQETVVGLQGALRQVAAFEDNMPQVVAQLVADIREVGLDRVEDLDFAVAATQLLPQLRPRSWLVQQGTFGDSGLVHTPLDGDLVVVYVVDDVTSMVFVCRAHLRRWRRTAADVHHLALANLARRGRMGLDQAAAAPVLVKSGDGFDAARLLLVDRCEGLLVAVPDRDTLWVGPEHSAPLTELMAATEAIAVKSPRPLCRQLLRITDGRLVPVSHRG